MERVAEPHPVQDVPHRLRHRLHGFLYRLAERVERLGEICELLGETRHERSRPQRGGAGNAVLRIRDDLPVDEAGTTRFETFSDGVFAIAATLLVLEITVSTNSKDLARELLQLWPSYLAYVTSFVTIGIIWMNHHHTVSLIGRTDRTMLFLNNLLLLTVAFLPFPTKLVGDYLRSDQEQAAALAYAATLLVMAFLHQAWWQYARRDRRLIAEGVPDSALRAVDRAYIPGVPMYGTVFIVAFFSPLAAVVITFAIAAFYLPSAALFDR
jgi:TMEM175 potassium channel family protein